MGPHETESICKDETKWQSTDCEKRKISTSDRGLASKIYKELKKLDTDNPNTLIKEWGTGLIREALTEMLNILIHQENANQSDERL